MVMLTMCDVGATGAFGLLPDRGHAYLSFNLDNDLFAGTDENYTNGIRIAWISGSRDPKQFGTVQRGLRKLIGDSKSRELKLDSSSDCQRFQTGLIFSQQHRPSRTDITHQTGFKKAVEGNAP